MQQCWEYEAEERPSFAHCLQCLQQIQVAALSQAPGLVQTGMTVHNAQYARTPGEYARYGWYDCYGWYDRYQSGTASRACLRPVLYQMNDTASQHGTQRCLVLRYVRREIPLINCNVSLPATHVNAICKCKNQINM